MTTQLNGAEHRVTHGKGQNPLAIANYYVQKANEKGKPLSILHLVKLVYLAHGWCLGHGLGNLISTPVEAWQHGPVVREVYEEFRPHGSRNISAVATAENGEVYQAELTPDQKHIVNKVYEAYSRLSPFAISDLTHARGTPWAQTEGHYALIDNDIIQKYYENRVKNHQEQANDV